MSTTLARLDAARTALAEARSMDDILQIRDIAEAARVYAKAARESLSAQNYAAEIKLRAERKAGEMLQQMEKHNGRPKKRSLGVTVSLDEIGVDKMQSSRWQKEASVSEAQFEELVSVCNERGEELTQASLLRTMRR